MYRKFRNPFANRKRRRRGLPENPEKVWARGKGPPTKTQKVNRRIRWVVGTLAFLSVAAMAAVMMRRQMGDMAAATDGHVPSVPIVAAVPPPETPEAKSSAAIEAVIEFLSTTDLAQRERLLFAPSVEAPDMADYYVARGRSLPTSLHDYKVTAVGERGREFLIVTFRDADKRLWAAPMEWADGGYKLHWGAMTGYGEMPWQQFLESRPESAVRMRVKLFRSSSPLASSLPPGHQYVLVTHPELPQAIGALLRDGPSMDPIRNLPDDRDVPACVMMQWQDFGADGQWPVINRLVHRNWIP